MITWEVMDRTAMILGYVMMLGLIVLVVMVAYVLVDEASRAYLQVRRIERVSLGKGKRVSARLFWGRWRSEYMASYTRLIIRGVALPHDPRKPIRRDW
ncbi:hypothetical protein [Hyphomicrobium sp. 99]|uniref:hypothetical protein n=1 Tax=Hyphomicrobium sp. 99 TaxID=1163419 RepID=UPI0005F815C8|nr:hypothetical protein [Hyphomicrobium sp. 99]